VETIRDSKIGSCGVECVKDSRRQESEEIIVIGCVNDESRRSRSEESMVQNSEELAEVVLKNEVRSLKRLRS
jgi:hypothetical protein